MKRRKYKDNKKVCTRIYSCKTNWHIKWTEIDYIIIERKGGKT